MLSWFASASSPNEFVMVKFTLSKNKKSREVVTGSYNSYEGLSAGINDAQKVPFFFVKINQGIYKVQLKEGEKEGQFGFLYAGSATTYGMRNIKCLILV